MEIIKIYLKDQSVADKVLRDRSFNIAKNPRYDGYQRGLALMVFFCEKTGRSS